MDTAKRLLGGSIFLLALAAFCCRAQSPGGGGGGGGSGGPALLEFWQFSDTNWLSHDSNSPLGFANLALSTNGDGGASLLLDSTDTAYLNYAVVESSGHTNLIANGADGSFSFWFSPSWSSGMGPGGWGRLLEVGAFTTNAGAGCFSLYLSPDGENIMFSTEDTNGVSTNVISAPISWRAGTWHFLVLNYSTTNNCALYCDGAFLTNGPTLSLLPGQGALSNGFFFGSDYAGAPENQAHGTFDDLYVYRGTLDPGFIQATYSIYGVVIFGVTNFTSSAPFVSVMPGPTNGFSAVTGPGFLEWVGPATNVTTGGTVYIANPMAATSSNFSSEFQFSIGGGTNGVPYDVFATAAFIGEKMTDSQWYWLGQGYTGNTYLLEGEPAVQAYYLLGTPQDSDGDGLTDAYELLVSRTDPNNPDSSYSGLGDGWYVAYGLNPLNPFAVPQFRLGYWRFNTNSWQGEQGQLPMVANNLASTASWSGTAVNVDSGSSANLRYRDYQPRGMENINCANGSVRFWFNPDWTSGTGPGSVGQLLEMGDGTASGGYWSLSVSADGTEISFQSATNNMTTSYLTGDISFNSNTWHQLVITYTAGSNGATALYVDGSLVTFGPGIASWPSASARAAYGFNLGSSRNGDQQSRGSFDELETFDYPLTADAIADNYNAIAGLNPLPILSFTNDFVTNAAVTASISGSAATMAWLVNSVDFGSATWIPFATNATIDLGTGEGKRLVMFGFAGLNGQPIWIGQHITVDQTPPLIAITSPLPESTGSLPMIQLQGYSSEPLSSITYDLTNAAGLVTSQPGLIASQFYDTNLLDFTTNGFQCFDIVLTSGLNTITIRAVDRAGNQTVTNINYTLVPGTTAPVITNGYPDDGESIGSSTFTMEGWLDNPTATVSLTISDNSGNTNFYNGMVARNGRYWVDNVNLFSGDNNLTLTVTDPWGNSTSNNLTVAQGPVTIYPWGADDLFDPPTSVMGYVDDPAASVSVNGVQASVDVYGIWTATNVYFDDDGSGAVKFLITAQTSGLSQNGSAQLNTVTRTDSSQTTSQTTTLAFIQEKPPRLQILGHKWNWNSSVNSLSEFYDSQGNVVAWGSDNESANVDFAYSYNHPGSENGWSQAINQGWNESNGVSGSTNVDTAGYTWGSTKSMDPVSSTSYGDAVHFHGRQYVPIPYVVWEHTDVNYSDHYTTYDSNEREWYQYALDYHRFADSDVQYYTGGRNVSGIMGSHEFQVNAWHIGDAFAQPFYFDPTTGDPHPGVTPIAPERISLANIGQVNSEGLVGKALPEGTRIILLAQASGSASTVFQANPTKRKVIVTCDATIPTNRNRTTIGVGEGVTISFYPPATNLTVWKFGSVYANHTSSTLHFFAPDRATNLTVIARFPDNSSNSITFAVKEPTGVEAQIASTTRFVINPGTPGAWMQMNVTVQPTTVSFYRIQVYEPAKDAVNKSGYFLTHQTLSHGPNQGANIWHPVGQDNVIDRAGNFDEAGYYGLDLMPLQWSTGSFTWPIPAIWKIDAGASTNLPWSDEYFSLAPDGTVTATKFGQKVERKVNNFITPRL